LLQLSGDKAIKQEHLDANRVHRAIERDVISLYLIEAADETRLAGAKSLFGT